MVFPGKQEILELKSFIIFDEKEKLFFWIFGFPSSFISLEFLLTPPGKFTTCVVESYILNSAFL
jgi:hypothetical protein